MTHNDFNRFLLEKYGTYDKINATHHYQTKEVKNQGGAVVVPAELQVESDYSVTYYDWYHCCFTTGFRFRICYKN